MSRKWLKIGGPLAGCLGLVVLILVQVGLFDGVKIGPRETSVPAAGSMFHQTSEARLVEVPEAIQAVGTVRSRTQTQLASQVTARIESMSVRAGDRVARGQILVRLDDQALRSRLDQARKTLEASRSRAAQSTQAIAAAQAGFDTAKSRYERMRQMLESGAVSVQDMEQAEAAYLQAKAGLQQAKDGQSGARSDAAGAEEMLEEARITLEYAVIRAPEAGEVVKRLAEPGDMAWAGRPLLELHAGQSLQLEALVQESLVTRVGLGQELLVRIDALDRDLSGRIEEIVPSADPASRTFVVKAALESGSGVLPGMFGRLFIPLGQKTALVAPEASVVRVGQLEAVWVRTDDAWSRVQVTTGRLLPEGREVLSGLEPGDVVGIPEA